MYSVAINTLSYKYCTAHIIIYINLYFYTQPKIDSYIITDAAWHTSVF